MIKKQNNFNFIKFIILLISSLFLFISCKTISFKESDLFYPWKLLVLSENQKSFISILHHL